MQSGDLNKRVRILRHRADATNAFGEPEDSWTPCETVWAAKTDVSDAERVKAQGVGVALTSRFVVRRSRVTETVTFQDRLWFRTQTFEITGLKDVDRDFIEISAAWLREVKG